MTVVAFRPRADVATARSRKAALPVIIERLRELNREGGDEVLLAGQIDTMVRRGGLTIHFRHVPAAGLFFGIHDGSLYVMSGYIDPIPSGRDLNGKAHVMRWKHRETHWERKLFV